MTITIDTREQSPWAFSDTVETEVGTLKAGDYALKGDATFCVERKSLEDFLGTISTGWDRFQRELYRMDCYGVAHKIVVVEGDADSIYFKDADTEIREPEHNHPRLEPSFVMMRVAELLVEFRTAVLFAGCAEFAAAQVERIFIERQKQLRNEVAMLKDLAGRK